MTVESFEPDALRILLSQYDHTAFPVVKPNGKVEGLVSRADIERFLDGGSRPTVLSPTIAAPAATLGDVERTLIETPLNVVLLVDQSHGTLVGLFTLHDLLRSQRASVDGE